MRAFLDFEASSLAKAGYPIEVAWVFETGESETHLIKPADGWIDWDEKAEAIHHIPRASLLSEGTDHAIVAQRLLDVLIGHQVHASSPSWDGKWLSLLLRSAGLPRHALRLIDTDIAQQNAVAEILGDAAPASAAGIAIVAEARRQGEALPVDHRALSDAERERQIWLIVRRLALAYRESAG